MRRTVVARLLTLAALWLPSPAVFASGVVRVPADALERTRIADMPIPAFPLLEGWRYHAGHSPSWAAAGVDDAAWLALDSLDIRLSDAAQRRIGWSGSGWFRLHLAVDPDLSEPILGLIHQHAGAIEIYLDGLLVDAMGRVGEARQQEVVEAAIDPPRLVALNLVPGREHVIAVRYSSHWSLGRADGPDEPGFHVALVDPREYRRLAQRLVAGRYAQQMLFAVPLAFALLHVLLYLYHRRRPGNLHYAAFALSVSVLIYAPLQLSLASTSGAFVALELLFEWALVATVLTGLLFLYCEFLDGPSRLFRGICAAGILIALFAWAIPLDYIYYFTLACLVDLVRVVYLGLRRRREGAWVVRAGWLVFTAACALQVLVELRVVELPFLTSGVFFPYVFGILALVFSMSVYLARDVARTNQELAQQLVHVRELSDQAVEHEREVQAAKLATLNHLVAGIVHEMNSPVGTIQSARDTLTRALAALRRGLGRDDGPPAADDPLRRPFAAIDSAGAALAAAVDRLGKVLADFKAFSHLDEAEWQMANVEAGLDSAIAVMASQIDIRIRIVKEYGGVAPTWCSPARLNQVFMHLVANATAAIPEAGEIRLKTWEDARHVYASVADTGVGIPADRLEGLFDVGFRRRGRVQMGMGLVADCRTVREHGGDMEVSSRIGHGTQVVVKLPRRVSDVQ